MKTILSQLFDDFQERKLPSCKRREQQFSIISGKANVAIGMRRTGKTFFVYQKIHDLLEAGITKDRIFYLNFEDDRLFGFTVNDFQTILDVYYAKYPDNRGTTVYFLFDEIQSVEHWEQFVRRVLDSENIQIYLTGSSAKLLSMEIATSLRGRALVSEIFPFSFTEFLLANSIFSRIPESFSSTTQAKLRKAAADYFEVGGFPEVQNIQRHLRTEILQSYIDAVILKDVVERHRVSNVTALKYLIQSITHASGCQFSVNKFYNTLKSMTVKCTKNNLYEYLDHLIEAYLFYRVPIHSRSEKARIVNPAKIYTIDTGLLNSLTYRKSINDGLFLENLVFIHLRRVGYEVEYLHPRAGGEVDFVARRKSTGEVVLIQVCWNISDPRTFRRELTGLQNGMRELSIKSGTIITWDDESATGKDGDIAIIPVWKWLLAMKPD